MTRFNERLKIYVELFEYLDKGFWYAAYIFLALQGVLIVGYTQLLTSNSIINDERILLYFPLVGCIISTLWLFLMNRKMVHIRSVEEKLEDKLSEIWDSYKDKQKGLAKYSGAYIMHTGLPIIFIIVWLFFFIYMLIN